MPKIMNRANPILRGRLYSLNSVRVGTAVVGIAACIPHESSRISFSGFKLCTTPQQN